MSAGLRQSDKRRIFGFVSAVANLRQRDVEGALAFVADVAASTSAEPFDVPVVEKLLDLVRADRAGYYECPYPDGRATVDVSTSDIGSWDPEVAAASKSSWTLSDERLHSATAAMRFGDSLSRNERQRNPWYQGVMRPHSVEYECKLWLPAPEGEARAFFFSRGPDDHEFTTRETSLLTLLRPHLATIRDRWEQRRRPASLTDRELEIVRLLREGLTNQEIADRLVIATGTVRTHLENIFEKLDVHTRTAAVARAFGLK